MAYDGYRRGYVSFAHFLLYFNLNIHEVNENIKNLSKLLKIKGNTYKTTHISIDNYPRATNLISK